MELLRVLGRNICAERHRLGMTQIELARKVGITAGHLSSVERAVKAVHLSTLERLAKVLRVEAGGLLDSEPLNPRIKSGVRRSVASSSGDGEVPREEAERHAERKPQRYRQ